ncbi:MAG TPA: hypothetical protein VKH44_08825, partial [Pirellulaceae bacterium]|nr:hypothetical protein [Pirellulaceae bacterium]
RESASEELARIGLPAFAALETAVNHPDREVRYRSQRVLGIIRRHDNERRIEAFLSGKDDADEYPLPGWTRFHKAYGNGPEQRKLFIEMQRADAELLLALEENPRRAAETLAQRTFQVQQAMQPSAPPVSLGQVSVSLFVAAEPDVTLPGQSLSSLFSQCYQPAIREAIDSGARREIPRKMLGAIISRCEDLAAFQAMTVATQFKLPEGIIPATKILKNHEGLRTAPLAQHALIAIARLGDASHLPLVETDKLMHDATQVAQFKETLKENEITYFIQLRDVALAASVVLSKQDLRSYFDIPPNQPLNDPQMIFLNPRLIGFEIEDKRAAAFAKWEKYKAAQTAAR